MYKNCVVDGINANYCSDLNSKSNFGLSVCGGTAKIITPKVLKKNSEIENRIS